MTHTKTRSSWTSWLAPVLIFLLCLGAAFLADRWSGAYDFRTAQEQAKERSECITEYRSEWQNAIGDIVLVASRGNDPSTEEVLALAQAQRHSAMVNDLCDPTQDGGVQPP